MIRLRKSNPCKSINQRMQTDCSLFGGVQEAARGTSIDPMIMMNKWYCLGSIEQHVNPL
jgi:hypothetical protein